MPNGAIAFATAKSGLVTFSKYIAQEFDKDDMTPNIVKPICPVLSQLKALL